MAGESARRKYEAIRDERRATLQSGRWILLGIAVIAATVGAIIAQKLLGAWWLGAPLGLLPVFNLLLPSQREVAWRKGAEGEAAVGRKLDGLAPTSRALHDRLIPGSRANIDHILVAPTGVWTVDAKNYTGKIETRRRGTELWVKGRNRSKLLTQAQRQRDVVRGVLARSGLANVPVHPSLCFLGVEWPLLFRPTSADGVSLIGPRQLGKLGAGHAVLTPATVDKVTAALDAALRPATATHEGPPSKWEAPPEAAPAPPTRTTGTAHAPPGPTVKRWTRYGKDRLYVNDSNGETLGYVDLVTNDVVPAEEQHRAVISEVVTAYLRND